MTSATENNPYAKYGVDKAGETGEGFDYDYYDPHCFFSSGLAQNRRRLGFIATCSTVQCKDSASAGYDPLLPFKEDLAEWLYKMIRVEIDPDKFYQELQSGVYLCRLGIHMQGSAIKYRRTHPDDTSHIPANPPRLKYANATRKSPPFYCRDNISNFLTWSIDFGVKLSCRFETDDLSMRKNDRQIVIHLMEVGRMGVKFGIEPPTLIKLEMALEEPLPAPKKGASTLDEKVQACAAECNCSIPFKVNRVSEGKYRVGEGRSIVFVRVLRSHVMVRVGGGWETLAAYFSKMDPCRAPVDSFGKGGGASRAKQRFQSQEEEEPQQSPRPAKRSVSTAPSPQTPQYAYDRNTQSDGAPPTVYAEQAAPVRSAAPPMKPRRPAAAALSKTNSAPKPAPAQKAPVSRVKSAAPRRASPSPTPAKSPTKSPVRQAASSPASRTGIPSPRPSSAATRMLSPTPNKTSLLRTSPSAIKTSAAAKSAEKPPWKFVPASTPTPRPASINRPAAQKPASRASGEAGPTTPNFQKPARHSTIDRTVPPTQNKRLVPVGGKSLPKSDKYNRQTQSVSGRPKITSPELIRRAMDIMGDNGEKEQEDVVRKPTTAALKEAIVEIADQEAQCDAEEHVEVEMPDSGVDTMAESKLQDTYVIPPENATLGDSTAPLLAGTGGTDTLQDISDMITDDQDKSEMEGYDDLPRDDVEGAAQLGLLESQDLEEELPSVNAQQVGGVMTMPTTLVEAEIEEEPISESPSVDAGQIDLVESIPTVEAAQQSAPISSASDYEEGGTTEDELNEAVGEGGYGSKLSTSSDGQGKEDLVNGEHADRFIGITIKSDPTDFDTTDGAPQLELDSIAFDRKGSCASQGFVPITGDEEAALHPHLCSSMEDPYEEDTRSSEATDTYFEEELAEGEDEESSDSKNVYIADLESEYDISKQIEAMNEVERAIAEGEEEEDEQPVTPIPESTEKRREEFKRVQQELKDSINAFQRELSLSSQDDGPSHGDELGSIAEDEPDSVDEFVEQTEKVPEVVDEPTEHLETIPQQADPACVEYQQLQEEPQKEFLPEIPINEELPQEEIAPALEEQVIHEVVEESVVAVKTIPEPVEDLVPPPPEFTEDKLPQELTIEDLEVEDVQEEMQMPDVVEETAKEEMQMPDVVEETAVEEMQMPDVVEETAEEEMQMPDVVEEADQEEIQMPDVVEETPEEEIQLPDVVEETAQPVEAEPGITEPVIADLVPPPPPELADDLEVIREEEDDKETQEQPLSESEEVVMKPDKSPLPNNNSLHITPSKYFSDTLEEEEQPQSPPKDFVEELKRRRNKRSLNSSGHTSDSDRSSASEKDTSSGYHEDYETSDGDELHQVPDVIMEEDKSTRSILKGSTRDSALSDVSRPSLSSTHSLPRSDYSAKDDDDVFDEDRAKGLNLPSEGHVREAVFTKAIEAAIHPLAAPDSRMPMVFDLQSASIVLPSKKAIRKASDGEYGYGDRRQNLERVISNQHTEKTDMEWGDEADGAPDKADGQTRDEKVYKWSGTLRSGPKKKRGTGKKKYSDTDVLDAIEQQMNLVRSTCPVHSKNPNAPMPSGHQQARRPTTAPVSRVNSAPVSRGTQPARSATKTPARNTAVRAKEPATPRTAPKTMGTPTKARQPVKRSVSTPVAPRPVVRGSKAVAVKPASHVMNPNEVMDTHPVSKAGPMSGPDQKLKINVTKSTPVRRASSLRGTGRTTPLKSSTLPRDKIRAGPKVRELP